MDRLQKKDLDELLAYFNEGFVGHTLSECAEFCEEHLNDPDDTVQFECEYYLDMARTVGNIHLSNDYNVNAFDRLTECFQTTYYDNGKPLTDPDGTYDYFEHYDRDTEFWDWFIYYNIKSFFIKNGEIHIELDDTLEDLKNVVTAIYGNESYEYDFGDSGDADPFDQF